MRLSKGFTLIELLLVIVIISVLSVTVFFALNPAKRLTDSRNARRLSDVDTILAAIHSDVIDNGDVPSVFVKGNNWYMIGTSCATANTVPCYGPTLQAACVDPRTAATFPLSSYLAANPVDPLASFSAQMTGYAVNVSATGLVSVRSCGAEGKVIVIQR